MQLRLKNLGPAAARTDHSAPSSALAHSAAGSPLLQHAASVGTLGSAAAAADGRERWRGDAAPSDADARSAAGGGGGAAAPEETGQHASDRGTEQRSEAACSHCSGNTPGSSCPSTPESGGLLGQLWDAAEAARKKDTMAAAMLAALDASNSPSLFAAPPEQPDGGCSLEERTALSVTAVLQPMQTAAGAGAVTAPPAAAACVACVHKASEAPPDLLASPGGQPARPVGSRKQQQAAAARRTEFLAAWRLAAWKAEEEKRFVAQLEVRMVSLQSITQLRHGAFCITR